MNEVILSKLSNSIGKLLVFNISFIDKNYKSYEEIFSAYLKDVTENYLIVEQININISEDNLINLNSVERKLFHGKYEIDTDYKKLNH